MSIPKINGFVKPGFEKVVATFEENFSKRDELGGACAVYIDNELVVNLWAGYKNEGKTQLWEEDTKTLVFSSTKGFSSLAFSLLHSKGLLDFDEKVSTYWPEFGAHGKEDITVRQLLRHEGGLMAIDKLLLLPTLKDKNKLGQILADQKPFKRALGKKAYHTWTISLYQSELARRIDPLGRSIGILFRDEIGSKLDADFHIGLPSNIKNEDIATIVPFNPITAVTKQFNQIPFKIVANFVNPFGFTARSFANPPLGISPLILNIREIRNLEIGSANGIGSAKSMARVYGEFASGGKQLKVNPATIAALEEYPNNVNNEKSDLVLREKLNFSLGLEKPSSFFNFGTNSRAYGHQGAGGSAAFADPERKLGFAYVMNKMGICIANDPREKAMRDAVYACL